jgi:hypothetical protein
MYFNSNVFQRKVTFSNDKNNSKPKLSNLLYYPRSKTMFLKDSHELCDKSGSTNESKSTVSTSAHVRVVPQPNFNKS